MTTVTLVELPTYENILPLVSGCLQVYASQDEEIAATHQFEIFSRPVNVDRRRIVDELAERDSDIYTMSCYIWNAGLVRSVLRDLLERRPDAHYLLGGPQVMNHAAGIIPPGRHNVAVCNGEGERTFTEYLRQLARPAPDLGAVPGLSYWSGGELLTTPPPPRIKDMSEMPSPFTAGVFADGQYTLAILETNRGCPYRCAFCYWGAATNDKVHHWETDRIKEDITWISEHGFSSIFIADANWGLAPRDVEITEHIVACKETYGFPLMIVIQAAKNKPERVAAITERLVRGGLMTTQPISLQTLSPEALRMVDRQNIRPATYTHLQRDLRAKQISSYVELIWPLPGETLASFKEGVEHLCRTGADTVIVYPQLLLHNTPMYRQQEVFGLETSRVPGDIAEADVVVRTKWVTSEERRQGSWFAHAMKVLYNTRGMFYLAGYLDRTGLMSYSDLLTAASEYFQSRTDHEVCQFLRASIDDLAHFDLREDGKIVHYVLHSHRGQTDELLADFAAGQAWWADPVARLAFELDLVARPFIYREPARLPAVPLRALHVVERQGTRLVVDLPGELAGLLAEHDVPVTAGLVEIDHHGRHKLPYLRRRSLEHNAAYCQAMIERLRDILPMWTVRSDAASLAAQHSS